VVSVRRFLALAVFLAGCGGAGAGVVTSSTEPTTTDTFSTSTSQSPATSTSQPATSTTTGGVTAPDFTLQLGDGGSYTLSQGEKPVYLVFWAEW
jgi:hypothetical protein